MQLGYQCKLCGKILTDKEKLLEHLKADHRPFDFYNPVFVGDWAGVKTKKKKKKVVEEEDDEEDLSLDEE